MNPVILSTQREGRPVVIVAVGGHAQGAPLPPRAIVGEASMPSGAPLWSTFRPGGPFLAFYASYMRGEQPLTPALLATARVRPGEKVYVLDRRSRERDDVAREGDVPWNDVIGWYDSDATGSPIARSFTYNPEHALVLAEGTMSEILFDDRVAQALVRF
ncbi:MAG: hypothetical protein U0235_07575 [Polyangiaceae bacterium]